MFAVEDPSTGETIAEVPNHSPQDAIAALDKAAETQASWSKTPPRDRGEILRCAFELITQRSAELAQTMTLEMGKPLAESQAEIAYGAEFFRWFSEEAVRISGRYSVAPNGATRLLTMKQPVGPSLLITPWNFPLAMGTRKIGPAIAAGCTMVVKPAALTPLTMIVLGEILAEAGLPEGVFNLVTTTNSAQTMAPLISDERLRKISFTGSTEVGRQLIAQSSERVLRTSMELGGNAPFIVFADADIDAAVDGAMIAKLRNGGEACTSANRFIVHESVATEFGEKLAARMSQVKVGRGVDPGVELGPLIDQKQRTKVSELVQDAVDQGAEVLTGGKSVGEVGYFYAPTVLTNVPTTARIFADEIFGPVAPIYSVANDKEAIDLANDTEYGLVAYLYSRDFKTVLNTIEALDTGMVGVNQGIVSNPAAPFGGVKASGIGREGGEEGINEYLETKYVGLNIDD